MNEQIEIIRGKCEHCGEDIARIPARDVFGSELNYIWQWHHVYICGESEAIGDEWCQPKTKAEPEEER